MKLEKKNFDNIGSMREHEERKEFTKFFAYSAAVIITLTSLIFFILTSLDYTIAGLNINPKIIMILSAISMILAYITGKVKLHYYIYF